jgi:hypothetical protein
MFGRVANTLDKNVIILLSLTAAILLLAGLCLAVTSPPAKAQAPSRPAPEKSLYSAR